jgi:hypothetical protein
MLRLRFGQAVELEIDLVALARAIVIISALFH